MARRRVKVKKIKDIIKLLGQNWSERRISKALGISKTTIGEYRKLFNASGLSPEAAIALDSDDLNLRLLPKIDPTDRLKALKTFLKDHGGDLGVRGVTRHTLWEDYAKNRDKSYGYSQFCSYFSLWAKDQRRPSMLFDHPPGEAVLVDYSGLGIAYGPPDVEKKQKAELLVMVLPHSGLVFTIALTSQNSLDTLAGCVAGLEYFGGIPKLITPDNMRTAVSKACRYQPITNNAFEAFADHYGMVVLPARAGRPKDKALVENAVQNIQRQVIARVRNCTFESVAEINETIMPLLNRMNDKPLQRLKISRRDRFKANELSELRPLPVHPYSARMIHITKVDPTYHVFVSEDQHLYSVPFRYIGKTVRVEISRNCVEFMHKNERIAFHSRSATVGGKTTLSEHMPESHRVMASPSRQMMLDRSAGIGVHGVKMIDLIYERSSTDLAARRLANGICALSKRFGDRVDMACRLALREGKYDYRSVLVILEREEDIAFKKMDELQRVLPIHENIRGSEAYR